MNTDSNQIIPTYFEQFDRFLNGGFPVGKLTFLARHTAIGVTQFGLSLAANIAGSGQYVGFFSLTMVKHLLEKKLQIMEETDIANYILMDDTARFHSPDELRKHITDMVQKPYEVKCIIFDYFEVLAPPYVDLAEMASFLQSLAQELNIAMLVGCHHNRFSWSDTTHIPTLKKLPYASAIIPSADRILYLYRSDYYRLPSGYCPLDCDKFLDEGYAQIGSLYPENPQICVLHHDAKHFKFTDR